MFIVYVWPLYENLEHKILETLVIWPFKCIYYFRYFFFILTEKLYIFNDTNDSFIIIKSQSCSLDDNQNAYKFNLVLNHNLCVCVFVWIFIFTLFLHFRIFISCLYETAYFSVSLHLLFSVDIFSLFSGEPTVIKHSLKVSSYYGAVSYIITQLILDLHTQMSSFLILSDKPLLTFFLSLSFFLYKAKIILLSCLILSFLGFQLLSIFLICTKQKKNKNIKELFYINNGAYICQCLSRNCVFHFQNIFNTLFIPLVIMVHYSLYFSWWIF